MSGASAVFILDGKGRVIISRKYRGEVSTAAVAERFHAAVVEVEEEGGAKPVFHEDGLNYCWIGHNNLYLVAVSERNANAGMLVAFLYKLAEVLGEYFKEVEEESIRDNFVVTYELLDELMDDGYPQSTEVKVLREFIKNEAHQLSVHTLRPPTAITNAVSWRSEGVRHKKNEIFLDVVERLNILVSANGSVLRSEIVGCLKMKSFLSGMPELKLGLNDKMLFETNRRGNVALRGKSVEMEDIKFHQCVRLARFENDRTISFIPPDGEFDLMSYRLPTHVKPLIWIEASLHAGRQNRAALHTHTGSAVGETAGGASGSAVGSAVGSAAGSAVGAGGHTHTNCTATHTHTNSSTTRANSTHSPTKIEYVIKAKSQFKSRSVANGVEIHIPVPADVDSPVFKTAVGNVKYFPHQDNIVWYIKQFQGQKDYVMTATFGLPSVADPDSRELFMRKPISVFFEIPYFTVSGITVRYLKIIEKSGYQALPWVRYITQNGDYQIRLS